MKKQLNGGSQVKTKEDFQPGEQEKRSPARSADKIGTPAAGRIDEWDGAQDLRPARHVFSSPSSLRLGVCGGPQVTGDVLYFVGRPDGLKSRVQGSHWGVKKGSRSSSELM